MRVVIVQEFVDARRGGAETSTIEMAEQLARLGLDVTVYCRPRTAADASPAERTVHVRGNVTYWPVPVRGHTRLGRTYAFVQAVHRLCRRERFDIVHAITPCLAANVYQPRGGTYPEAIARTLAVTRSPVGRFFKRVGRAFNIRQQFLMRLERSLLTKRAAHVTVAALSDYVRRQVVALGFPTERVRVVFNGVDAPPISAAARAQLRTEFRRGLGLPPAAPVLLFVAHNFRLKGLRELLAALACEPLAGRTDVQLLVAGRDAPEAYRRHAAQLGIGQRVHFVGTQTPTAMLYAAADALAHPTWYDPCSRVVLEALAGGLPVVTTRYNGAAEMMEVGRHGYIVDEPFNCERLARALHQALDPALAVACRAAAPALADRVSMSHHARELHALYEAVAADR